MMIIIIIIPVIIIMQTFIDLLIFFCAMYAEYAQQIWLLNGLIIYENK